MNVLKAFYSNLRIKYKMILLVSFVLLVFGTGSWFVMHFAFNEYNEEIYKQSAQALGVTSNGIENELKKMEDLSFRLSTDPDIQSYSLKIKESDTNYNQFLLGDSLRDRMLELGGLEKYVLSIQMFNVDGNDYGVGNNRIELSSHRIKQIMREAQLNQGGNSWIFPEESDSSLISAREVRSIKNLDLSSLGTIAVRIDLNKIFEELSRGLDNEDTVFMIMNDQEIVYPKTDSIHLGGLRQDKINRHEYQILEIEGDRYFVTSVPSSFTEWTYMIIIPYNNLFNAILTVQKGVFIVFAGLFVIVMYIAMRFVKGITDPIEGLNQKMKKVQLGKFELGEDENDRNLPMDEAGQMHRNFRMMLEHIDELITENYKKQLSIKESEFHALQAQINPHFLYNTLESINWSAKLAKQHDISQMVEALGFLLRNSINVKDPMVTLEDELKMVGSYIVIQKYRYEERLDFQVDIPDSLRTWMIPKMILQPLIENSIRYGLEQIVGVCSIRVTGEVKQGDLMIAVEDNGMGMDEELIQKFKDGTLIPQGTGIGLKNIDERIRLLFGRQYGLSLEARAKQGTKVYIRLPYREGHEDV